MSEPIHVSDAEFETKVLNAALPVVVDFPWHRPLGQVWAPWCGPCRMVAPVLEGIAREYDGRLLVAKVNTDEHPQWAMRYGVQGIPTLLFVSGGRVVDRQVGAAPASTLRARVDTFLNGGRTAHGGAGGS